MNYPIERNGYIYSKKTREGFIRMKRQGIPRPLFSIQDRLAKLLNANYRKAVRTLLKDLKARLNAQDITLDAAPEDENLEDLLKWFEEQGEKTRAENERLIERINLSGIADQLKKDYRLDEASEEKIRELYGLNEDFRDRMDRIFRMNQEDYMKRLFDDAPEKFGKVIASFEIDKNKFFADNLDEVRRLYLDNSEKRIAGELDWIKSLILQSIVDYAEGKTDRLKLTDLVKAGYEGSDYLSRLFARDQMQRFNKACTLSTFKNAGVTKVKWVTCGDGRVRNRSYTDRRGVFHRAHTELNGKIFDVNSLPIELDDYNCRCGLVPVEWADD